MSGYFITFEGIDGNGKTTQVRLLQERLERCGYAVLVTREPGGTPLAEALRGLLLDKTDWDMLPLTELFLYEAARVEHTERVIRPALDAGKVVLCDRFTDSTVAYQGYGRSIPLVLVEQLNEAAAAGVTPHVTFILDLPIEEAAARLSARGARNRLEMEPQTFLNRVRRGFHDLAQSHPDRIVLLDGSKPIDEVAEEVAAKFQERTGLSL